MSKTQFNRLLQDLVEASGLAAQEPRANFTAHCLRRGSAMYRCNYAQIRWWAQELLEWGGWTAGEDLNKKVPLLAGELGQSTVFIKYVVDHQIKDANSLLWLDHPERDNGQPKAEISDNQFQHLLLQQQQQHATQMLRSREFSNKLQLQVDADIPSARTNTERYQPKETPL
ncbi:hypothetical protein QFC21_004226 [Naganishia friedmannii]|uniref:Uncharacterized protein n=1 Tax=Naganishia friedmannii TaxID=89922 RepID=A0ACC2VHM0_9TREE|nr:hypothetical protein QFC21_004226 [Naganishia friedmannii]